MKRMNGHRGPSRRVHVVLVPGFAGFDALGQLEYYAGVTPLFREWKRARRARAHVVLHYFDNFPTAAVKTRALRLRSYIAKRMARGEFMPGDDLILVGHSTGGLDIRQLIWDLAEAPKARFVVDGDVDKSTGIQAADILKLIKRVVFLSVPQWGTNIADWVKACELGRELVIADLRLAVEASQVPLIDSLEGLLVNTASDLVGSQLLMAMQDSLNEAQIQLSDHDPVRLASAQEAASQLALWLRHMATDMSVINDLTSWQPGRKVSSPAHFSLQQRKQEIAYWHEHDIITRSYATLGRRPFRIKDHAPRWEPMNPFTYAEQNDQIAKSTDVTYRTCYRMCAGGPFVSPPYSQSASLFGAGSDCKIEVWDNDGIVNTASMLWPSERDTQVVSGDHMDIVGHFKPVPANDDPGRELQAYDLLGSGSQFQTTFDRVWEEIFNFALHGLGMQKAWRFSKVRRTLRRKARVRVSQ